MPGSSSTMRTRPVMGRPPANGRVEGVWGNREVPPHEVLRRGLVGETRFPPRERAQRATSCRLRLPSRERDPDGRPGARLRLELDAAAERGDGLAHDRKTEAEVAGVASVRAI